MRTGNATSDGSAFRAHRDNASSADGLNPGRPAISQYEFPARPCVLATAASLE